MFIKKRYKNAIETILNEPDCYDYYPDGYSGYSRAEIGKPRYQKKKISNK